MSIEFNLIEAGEEEEEEEEQEEEEQQPFADSEVKAKIGLSAKRTSKSSYRLAPLAIKLPKIVGTASVGCKVMRNGS